MLHVIDAEAVSIPLNWLGVGVVTSVYIFTMDCSDTLDNSICLS